MYKKYHHYSSDLQTSLIKATRFHQKLTSVYIANLDNPFKYLKGLFSIELSEDFPDHRNTNRLKMTHVKHCVRFHRAATSLKIKITKEISENPLIGNFSSLKKLEVSMYNLSQMTLRLMKKLITSSVKIEFLKLLPTKWRALEILNRNTSVKTFDLSFSDLINPLNLKKLNLFLETKKVRLNLNLIITKNNLSSIILGENILNKTDQLQIQGFLANATVIDEFKYKSIKNLNLNFKKDAFPHSSNPFISLKYLENLREFALRIILTQNEDFFETIFNQMILPSSLETLNLNFSGLASNFDQDSKKISVDFLHELNNLKSFSILNSFVILPAFEDDDLSSSKLDLASFNLLKLFLRNLPSKLEELSLFSNQMELTSGRIGYDEEFSNSLFKFDQLKVLSLDMTFFPNNLDISKETSIETLILQSENFYALFSQEIKFNNLKNFTYIGNPTETSQDILKIIKWTRKNQALESIKIRSCCVDFDRELIQEAILLPSELRKLSSLDLIIDSIDPLIEDIESLARLLSWNPILTRFNLQFASFYLRKIK